MPHPARLVQGRPKWPLWLSAPLTTVAKTLALFEAGGKDRGRVNGYWDFLGRDGRSLHRRWRLFSVGGTSTLVGNLIGLAVYDVVAEGVRLEQEASGKSLGSAAARSVMSVLTTSQR